MSNSSFSHSVFYLFGDFGSLKFVVWEKVNSLPNDKILDWVKWKALTDNKINVTQKLKLVLGKGRKHFGKMRKCWLPAFSPLPKIFSKAFFFRVVKSMDCVVKT